jgi:hypothetical protein
VAAITFFSIMGNLLLKQLFGRCDYVEMTRVLIIFLPLLCRSYIGAQLRSAHGCHCSGWSIETSLRRYLHSWRIRRGIFSPNMGGSVIYGWIHLASPFYVLRTLLSTSNINVVL